MKRPSRTILAIGFIFIAWQSATPVAHAQFGTDRINRPFNRPTVSPYLNMLRGSSGTNAAVNYYGAVRPQQQFYAQNENLTQGLNQLQMQQNQPGQGDGRDNQNSIRKYRMGITGHATSFMSFGAGGSAGGGGGNNSGGNNSGGNGSGGGNSGGQSLTGGFSGHSVGFGSTGGSSQGF